MQNYISCTNKEHKEMFVVSILILVILHFFVGSCNGSLCLSLPQNTPSTCKQERAAKLAQNQATYTLLKPPKTITEDLSDPKDLQKCFLFPFFNLTLQQAVGLANLDQRESEWLELYLYLQRTFIYFLKTAKPDEFHSTEDFFQLYKKVRGLLTGNTDKEEYKKYFRYPSLDPTVKTADIVDCDRWKEDIVFVEQRLAALNPMSLQRLTKGRSKIGVSLSEIKKKMNLNFNWDKAVSTAVEKETTLDQVIDEQSAFIIHFPYLDNISNVDDITDLSPNDERKLKKSSSPIALFVSVFSSRSYQLKPVAIQIDSKQDSPVYTPKDQRQWLLAKEIYQVADSSYVEMIEHLLKTHIIFGPICLIARRTLSDYHPMGILLKQHCRGLFVTNTNGLPKLVSPGGYMHRLFSIGNVGSIELLNKGYIDLSWEDTDFLKHLEKRGVNDKQKLPYFPYRDDGKLIWEQLERFVADYVKLYYRSGWAVREDQELSNFVNELSASGTGENGGIGMLKDFPRKLYTVRSVIETFTRILWLPVQHNAVNYPIAYYGAFVPNMPTRLYDDSRAPSDDEYSFYNLPDSHVATVQSTVSMSLGSLRYDKLLDYSSEMQDKKAAQIVKKHYEILMGKIANILHQRNEARYHNGHLPYPYLVPGWIPNSIHT